MNGYLAAQSRFDEALEVLEVQLKGKLTYLVECYVAVACLTEQQKRARAFLEAINDDGHYKEIGLTMLMVDNSSQRNELLSIAERILSTRADSDGRIWALQALLIAGVDDKKVSDLARSHRKGTIDLLTPVEVMNWIAAESPPTDDDMRRIDRPTLRSQVQFVAGLRHYARGDNEKALKSLSAAIDAPVNLNELWAKYLVKKITKIQEAAQ